MVVFFICSGPPLTGTCTPLLPNNSVLIREAPFSEREHHMRSRYMYLLPRMCVLSRVSFKRGTTEAKLRQVFQSLALVLQEKSSSYTMTWMKKLLHV